MLRQVEVDAATLEALGPEMLQRLWDNLWPVDCQTCGRPLGQERPALRVVDVVALASASLHHRACQVPEWSTRLEFTDAPYMTWKSKTFMLSGATSTGERDDWALMVVNPGLERVPLTRNETGWEVGTVTNFRQLGLRPPGREFVVDRPVAGAQARLHRAQVSVQLDGWPDAWTGTASLEVQDRIHERGGVTVGVTTAVDPDELTRYEQLTSLMTSGELLLGWIPLVGAEDRRPLDALAMPASVTSYLLHWGERHASIAQVLGVTDRALSESEVFDWAAAQLFAEAEPPRPVKWNRDSEDPAAWILLDPVSARLYMARRHDDGWKLLKVLARIGGSGFATERQARKWAEQAVRRRAGQHVFEWAPAAGTGMPGSTLAGSAE